MARIAIPDGEGLERSRMWGHNPAMGKASGVFSNAIYVESSLDIRVREVARMRIAQINECSI